MMTNADTNSVLIVEDDDPTAELERRAFARVGTNAVVVSKAVFAIELLRTQQFSAILLDYHLPGEDSWSIFEAADLMRPKIPVVLVTGQGSEIIASEAIERGIAAYVKKSGTCWDQLPTVVRRVTKLSADQERLRVTAALFRLQACSAQLADEARRKFLAGMSHEIRTPLSLIIGWAYLLEKTPLSEDQSRFLDNLQLAGRALLGIVNDVLDLSKIEAGKVSLENEPFDPVELLRSVNQMMSDSAKTKGIELSVSPGAEPPCRVKGDAPRLRQILVNLVNNAIKFTQTGLVTITVSYTRQSAECILMRCEVADTGMGIEPDSIQGLFQPFTQADAATTGRFGGTGLGLSISRSLVHLMSGTMGVESTVEVGSTFWFEIPLQSTMGSVAGPPQILEHSEPGAGCLEGVRVLVVDDDDIMQEILLRILDEQGAIVTCCSDGASALEHVNDRGAQLDIVLIDVRMPVLDGNEATRRIRGDLGQTLPIIGLTAGALFTERKQSLDAGMTDVITKPFDPRKMLSEVRRLVDEHRGALS